MFFYVNIPTQALYAILCVNIPTQVLHAIFCENIPTQALYVFLSKYSHPSIISYSARIFSYVDIISYFLNDNISLSHTLNGFVPYGYVVILSNVCNSLSSLLLSAILLTSSVHTL